MSETTKTLNEMSMPELWAEAKRLGVSKDGKKDELIARLKEAQEKGGETMPNEKPKANKNAVKDEQSKEAVFISRYRELKLVNQSSYTKEVNGRVVVVPGTSIQFREGVYRTSDEHEIAFLDSHPNLGSTFTKVSRKDQDKASDTLIDDRFKTLEQREKQVAAREEALRRKEMAVKGQTEGAETPKATSGIRDTSATPDFE